MIDIRRCGSGDVAAVMTFIDLYWRKGHVLGTCRELMDWQHKEADGSYNYLLVWDSDDLLGVLGYIPTRRYDPALKEHNLLWLALWKVRDDVMVSGLGLRMLQALSRVEPHVAIGVSGINLTHPPMYTALRYKVAALTQYYLVNPNTPLSLVFAPADRKTWPHRLGGDAVFTEMDMDRLNAMTWEGQAMPQKTPIYFGRRFLQHPFYRYRVFLISRNCSSKGQTGLIATRIATYQGAAALRIVDFAGDAHILAHCGTAFHELMSQENVQYADFWQYGLPSGVLEASGFEAVDPGGSVIVPNYYEPFLAQNGRILCAVQSQEQSPLLVFRADGDQDRPNQLQ